MNNKLYLNGVTLETDSKPTIGKDYWGNSHEALIKRYYDDGEYFSLRDIKNTMKTMFAIYESAKNGGIKISISKIILSSVRMNIIRLKIMYLHRI